MSKILTDVNELWGRKSYVDQDGDDLLFIEQYDKRLTNAVFDRNKNLANEGNQTGEMRLVASIPPEVIMYWKEEKGVDIWNPAHADGVKRLLNDSDFGNTRIQAGTI
jgi:hypothetical protein